MGAPKETGVLCNSELADAGRKGYYPFRGASRRGDFPGEGGEA